MPLLTPTRPPRGTRNRRLVAVATAFTIVGAVNSVSIGTAQAALVTQGSADHDTSTTGVLSGIPIAAGPNTLPIKASNGMGAPALSPHTAVTVAESAAPAIDWTSTNLGTTTATTHVITQTAGDLIVAFVAAGGPAGATQKATVTSDGGLVWTLAKRTDAQRGTAEVWTARASGTLDNVAVTSSLADTGYGEGIMVFAFKQAPGTGQAASASHATGAPTGSLTTTTADSWVWAVGNDPTGAIPRTAPPNQALMAQLTDTLGDTYWVQASSTPTPTAGTKVTINDTAPTNDMWNLALVEID